MSSVYDLDLADEPTIQASFPETTYTENLYNAAGKFLHRIKVRPVPDDSGRLRHPRVIQFADRYFLFHYSRYNECTFANVEVL